MIDSAKSKSVPFVSVNYQRTRVSGWSRGLKQTIIVVSEKPIIANLGTKNLLCGFETFEHG